MQRKIIRLLTLLFCGLSLAASATAQSIHVEWGYTPPTEPQVSGYILYKEGTPVCQTQNPNATSMDCDVNLTATVTNFTLTATFDDGSESPHSAPFAFATSDTSSTDDSTSTENDSSDTSTESATITGITGNKLFTFSWGRPTDISTTVGYRIYLNNAFLCETTSSTDTSLACTANLLPEEMVFSMSQVFTDGTESDKSNLLVFNPTSYPEVYSFKLLNMTWEYSGDTSEIKAFRGYQNGLAICETTDTTARSLSCIIDVPSTNLVYGVKAVNSDGTETPLSNVLSYSLDETSTSSNTEALLASIQADSLTGVAPLTVSFSAAASTGKITQYQWDFGDGSASSASTASIEYTNAGTYTVKLTVVDAAGASSTATVAVIVTESTAVNTPPTAVISSSVAMGPAPLAVNFDGSGSSATGSGNVTGYSWSFGDGTTATGATAIHAFTSAGTYTTTLTVTDSNGLTGTATTPVVVTGSTENIAPTAVINATPNSGSAPLTVTFDASNSTDSDGSIASYTWYFGDGSSGSGKTVTHTYTTEATFTASLQVSDNMAATGTSSTTITVQPEEENATLNLEIGEVVVTGDWVRVTLGTAFTNPIVIAGPASFNDAAPGVIRLRNVDATGFDIKFAEWNYQDGAHSEEVVSYLVVEKGRYTLPNGLMLEAGSFAGTTKWAAVPFSESFANVPLVLTTVATTNEDDTISGRVKDVSNSGFSYYFREQETNVNKHVNETVNYLAWEPGKGNLGLVNYNIVAAAGSATNLWKNVEFLNEYNVAPLVLSDMQTTNGSDPSALRMQNISPTGMEVKVEEEQSKDSEVTHSEETVGYIALNQNEEQILVTFAWDFDVAQEGNIAGFSIEANGKQVCAGSDPSARKIQCVLARPTSSAKFTIRAVEKNR